MGPLVHKNTIGTHLESPVLIAINRLCIDSLEALAWNLKRFLITLITLSTAFIITVITGSRAFIFRLFRLTVRAIHL